MIEHPELSKAALALLASTSLIKGSPEQDKLNKALARVQAELRNPNKNCEATVRGLTKDGKPYNYAFKYADLAECLNEIRPITGKHGIAFIQPVVRDGGSLVLVTRLTYEEQWIESEIILPAGISDIQKFGGALSYLRRYIICSLIGIAGEEDADGDSVDHNPEEIVKEAKATAEAEEKKIQQYRELFSAQKTVEDLKDVSTRHADLIGKLSAAGRAGLKRHYQTCEQNLRSKLKNDGN